MPTSYTWYVLPEQNSEVMEVVATDAHTSSNLVRGQLIELAALLMEDGANNLGRLETPRNVEVSVECDRSLKMTVSYANQGQANLVTRMVDRRAALLKSI